MTPHVHTCSSLMRGLAFRGELREWSACEGEDCEATQGGCEGERVCGVWVGVVGCGGARAGVVVENLSCDLLFEWIGERSVLACAGGVASGAMAANGARYKQARLCKLVGAQCMTCLDVEFVDRDRNTLLLCEQTHTLCAQACRLSDVVLLHARLPSSFDWPTDIPKSIYETIRLDIRPRLKAQTWLHIHKELFWVWCRKFYFPALESAADGALDSYYRAYGTMWIASMGSPSTTVTDRTGPFAEDYVDCVRGYGHGECRDGSVSYLEPTDIESNDLMDFGPPGSYRRLKLGPCTRVRDESAFVASDQDDDSD